MKNILWFSEINKENVPQVGGKGANLGEMYNIKLPIPPGFIVSAGAYKKFLEKTGIKGEIFSLLKNLDIEDTEKIHEASEKIQEIVLDARMPEEIKEDITNAYDTMNVDIDVYKSISKDALKIIKAGRDLPFVAVRSSATAEDLPSISEDEYVFVKINNKPFFGKMKELVDFIKYNDEVYVPTMDNFEVSFNKVSNIYKHKVNCKNLFKITTSTGKQITISPNHTIITLDEDTLEPKV